VPRCGGVAIVATFLAGLAVLWSPALWGLAASALVIALVGLADDLGRLGVAGKLVGQIAAAAILLASGVVLDELVLPRIGTIELGVWGYAVTLFWLVAITNMVNFMDGLDGLAGGTGVIAAFAFAALAGLSGSEMSSQLAAVLGAACLGFTLFNAPQARIFMGDVGSEPLGFLLAALAVLAASNDLDHTSALVMPLLLFHFIFDTVFTFTRRLLAGENVTQAHRGHLYQLLNRLGASQFRVSLLHYAIGLAQAGGAYLLLSVQGGARWAVFLPFLVFEGLYAATIVQLARRKGILAP
jgi:UDP-GlcNAc:undecaprenyl-phosphate GlcNAc-1-phosphate transferase